VAILFIFTTIISEFIIKDLLFWISTIKLIKVELRLFRLCPVSTGIIKDLLELNQNHHDKVIQIRNMFDILGDNFHIFK